MQALSRKEIIESVKLSLINLGLEYIDLVIVHKYDHNCPVEGNNYNGPSINDVSSEGKNWEDFHKIRCLLISFRYLHSFSDCRYCSHKIRREEGSFVKQIRITDNVVYGWSKCSLIITKWAKIENVFLSIFQRLSELWLSLLMLVWSCTGELPDGAHLKSLNRIQL